VTVHVVDIGVIGGGPAGLAAALWAGRYRRSVVLFDGGTQRNRHVSASHGYLGFDGVSPRDLLETARGELRRYSDVELRAPAHVSRVRRVDGGFDLALDGGVAVRALRLVLATGVRDELPVIDGIEA
jgi:thioredoxin reductase